MRRDANPSRRPLITVVIIASVVCVALAGARDAEIAAAIKARVEAKKAVGMVVATIEPDGSSSLAAFGDAGPGAKPLDADSVFEVGSITKVFTTILLADLLIIIAACLAAAAVPATRAARLDPTRALRRE